MNTVQVTNISAEEFQKLLADTALSAARQAVDAYMKVKEDPNEELTITKVAEVLNCSKWTVSARIKGHLIPTSRIGRDVSVKRKHLEALKKPVTKQQ